jgi:hypothetical protein
MVFYTMPCYDAFVDAAMVRASRYTRRLSPVVKQR